MLRRLRAIEVLVYGAILFTLLVVARQLWTTDLGLDTATVGDRVIVTSVDPDGPAERAGIQPGDEIVELPGLDRSGEQVTERQLFAAASELGHALREGRVPLRIERGGHTLRLTLIAMPPPRLAAAIRQLGRMASELPAAFAFLGVAALLVRAQSASREDDRARRTVAAAFALMGPAWTIEWPAPGWPRWLYPVASLIDAWTTGAGLWLLLRFAWSYPTRSPLVDRRTIPWALAIAGVPCAAFSSLNTLSVIDAPPAIHGNALLVLFDTVVASGILAGLAWQRAKARETIARRQATWLLASVGIGFFVPILLLMVPKHVFRSAPPFLDVLVFPCALVTPLGFAAVVARYRLFALDGLTVRAAPYAIALVTAVLVCALVTLGLQSALEWRTGTTSDAARWAGVLAAVVITDPLRRFLQTRLDRIFARDRDAFLRRCAELAAKLSGASDARAIEAAVQLALDAKVVHLLTLGDGLPPSSVEPLRVALARSGIARVFDLPNPAAVDALHARGIELLVLVPPADPEQPPSQALALTLPRPAHLISRPEHDALALVGRVIGAALAQAAARRALAGELRRAEDERRHIAMELHDGLGAALAAASLMTRSLRGRSSTSGEHALDALDAALRDGLGDLRASLWSLDPEQAGWDGLVARVRRHVSDTCAAAKVELAFHVEGAPPGDLSAAARLAILRVVQEAVNNALRHAKPGHLDVRMILEGERLAIVVDDDGVGIAPDAPRGRGLGNMARRIEALAGTFCIERREPAGTRVAVTLPLARLARDVPTDDGSPVAAR